MKKTGLLLGIFLAAVLLFFTPDKVSARDSDGDIVIIVDPGHGGGDSGAAQNGVYESSLNWNIAMSLKAELETYSGVKVYLTRGSAEWFSNAGRGRLGAQLGADLFVSCHNNSGGGGAASGVEVYGTVNSAYKASIQTLCTMIAEKVSALGLHNGGYRTHVSTGDSSRDYYTMLDEAVKCGIPGLIIEHCYVDNASDAAFISNTTNQLRCGAADAAAIAQYYGLSKRGVQAGGSVTLTRTYSAYIQGGTGSYASSNTGVAYVREDGLVTAVGEGSATITFSTASGTSSVNVTVPAVYVKNIAAGINPTFAQSSSFDRSVVMLKAIYSDGSVTQISSGNFTVGSWPASASDSYGAYYVPVTYGGLSCNLAMYPSGGAGSYSAGLYKVTGTNADILVLPGSYDGITTGGNVVTPPVTQAPTEPPATDPVATEEETTQEETTTQRETTISAPTTSDTTRGTTSVATDIKGNKSIPVWPFAVIGVIAAGGAITASILLIRRLRSRED